MLFSKLVRNRLFSKFFTTPKQEQCMRIKPILLHIAYA